jgi:hypothetical protein
MSAHLSDELLAAHLDGTSTPAEREATDAHLAVCARCRDELELAAGARDALRALPQELRPPRDVAASVAAAAAPGDDAREHGSPRWYRAAGVVAIAAAIGLTAVIVPGLGGRTEEDLAGPAASAPEGQQPVGRGTDQAAPTAGAEAVEDTARFGLRSAGDVDDADLRRLLNTAGDGALAESVEGSFGDTAAQDGAVALECLRSAGASPDVRPVRLLDATYRGTRAFVGVFGSPSDDRATLLFVASKEDCRLLASGSNRTGVITATE